MRCALYLGVEGSGVILRKYNFSDSNYTTITDVTYSQNVQWIRYLKTSATSKECTSKLCSKHNSLHKKVK